MRLWLLVWLLLLLQYASGQNAITYRLGRENRMVLDTLLPIGTERFVLEVPVKSYGGSPLAWLNGNPVATRLVKRQVSTLRPPASWMELLLANVGKVVEIEVDEGKTNLVSYSGTIMPIDKDASIVMLKTDHQAYEFIEIGRIVHFNGPNLLTEYNQSENLGVVVKLPELNQPTPLTISILLLETNAKAHLVLDTTGNKQSLSLQASIRLPWVLAHPSTKFLEFSMPAGVLRASADSLKLKEGEQTVVLARNFTLDSSAKFWKLTLKGQDPFKPNPTTDSYPVWSLKYRYNESNLLEDLVVIPKSYEWEVSNSEKGVIDLTRQKRTIYATEPTLTCQLYKSKFKYQGKKYEMFEVTGYVLLRNTETETASIQLERRAVYDKSTIALLKPEEDAGMLEWVINETVNIDPKSTLQVPYKYYLLKPLDVR